jgi:hypothetical protein
MNKLAIAVLAGFLSLAVGAYAAEDMKKDMKKDTGMSKGEPMKGDMKAAPAPRSEMKGDMADDSKKGRRAARASKG